MTNGEDGQLGGAVLALLQIFMSRVHYAGRTSSTVITSRVIGRGGRRQRSVVSGQGTVVGGQWAVVSGQL